MNNENKIPLNEILRPKNMDNILGNKNIIKILKKFVEDKSIPNLLFYGSPGIGKTTTAFALCHELFGENFNINVLELNASDNRNIQVVRDLIKDFVRSGVFFNTKNNLKIVILDEADSMTNDAQFCLRRIIEKFNDRVRFIFICNNLYKIIPAIQSRCTSIQFLRPDIKDVNQMLGKNNLKRITKNVFKDNDLRKLLNDYQIENTQNIMNEEKIIEKLINTTNIKKYLEELFFINGIDIVTFNNIITKYYLKNPVKNKFLEKYISEAVQFDNSKEFAQSHELIEIISDLLSSFNEK